METTEQTHIIIAGTGAEGRLAQEILTAQGVTVLGYLTDKEDEVKGEINDISIFAEISSEDTRIILKDEKMQYFVAISDAADRKEAQVFLAEVAKRPPGNIIHAKATVSSYATLGFGNLINAGCVIDPNAVVGDQNIFHAGVLVGTDARISHYCTLGLGCIIGANAKIEEDVFIGTGAIISPGVTVGKGAKIMAGSVVVTSVPEGETMFGNPAKAIS